MAVSEACKKAQRKYHKTAKGKNTQKRYEQTEKGKATRRLAIKRFVVRNPNYHKARHAVSNAIRDGKIPRPDTLHCYCCKEKAEQYHHWNGYEPEHWLDVWPVCIKCHSGCDKNR